MIFTVSEVNRHVGRLLDDEPLLKGIDVRGEISNLKVYDDGRAFFTLKDEGAAITCICFDGVGSTAEIKNGDKAVVTGNISLYVRDGRYQLIVKKLQIAGLGYWYQRFEALERKLLAEGLFDSAHKKALPHFPKVVGIVTSDKGAALQDMLKVLARRWPLARVIVYPTLVQGAASAAQISEAIEQANEERAADVLIVGRGGGSVEDLWAFNEECVARSIYASSIPVISAVGHETDFTIADFVADVRAATPSVAAELAVPLKDDVLIAVKRLQDSLNGIINAKLEAYMHEVSVNQQMIKAAHPQRLLDEAQKRRELLSSAIASGMNKTVSDNEGRIMQLTGRIRGAAKGMLTGSEHAYESVLLRITALDPMAVLSRGYAVIMDDSGKMIGSASDLTAGDSIAIRMGDGLAKAEVTEVNNAG